MFETGILPNVQTIRQYPEINKKYFPLQCAGCECAKYEFYPFTYNTQKFSGDYITPHSGNCPPMPYFQFKTFMMLP